MALVQDCNNSIDNALELLHSFTKPLMYVERYSVSCLSTNVKRQRKQIYLMLNPPNRMSRSVNKAPHLISGLFQYMISPEIHIELISCDTVFVHSIDFSSSIVLIRWQLLLLNTLIVKCLCRFVLIFLHCIYTVVISFQVSRLIDKLYLILM